jgi:hypothetical protein
MIPVMIQDGLKGAQFWSPRFAAGRNLVIDIHVYFYIEGVRYSNPHYLNLIGF